MKKILILFLSISLASNSFGMWVEEKENGIPVRTWVGDKSISIKFAFDNTSKEQLTGFLSLMVNTGENFPDAGAENHAVQVYKKMQEKGLDGLVEEPAFVKCFNFYFHKLIRTPGFEKAEHSHSKEEWKKVCWDVAHMLNEKDGIEFPQEEGPGTAKKFLELNAKLPKESDMALMAGALLQLVPGQMRRELGELVPKG